MQMVRINLLPPEIIRRRTRRRRQLKMVLGAAVLVALLVLVFAVLHAETRRTQQLAGVYRQETETLQEASEDYTHYVQKQDAVRRREDILSSAVGQPPPWLNLFRALGINIPVNTWLTDLHITFDSSADQPQGQVRMQGYTYTHTSTARWLEELERIEWLEDIRCSFSTAEPYGRYRLTRFEMTATIPAGQPYEPELQWGDSDD